MSLSLSSPSRPEVPSDAVCGSHAVLRVRCCKRIESCDTEMERKRTVKSQERSFSKDPSSLGTGGYCVFEPFDGKKETLYSLELAFDHRVHVTSIEVSGVGFRGSTLSVALDRNFRAVISRSLEMSDDDDGGEDKGVYRSVRSSRRVLPVMMPEGQVCKTGVLFVRETDVGRSRRHRYGLTVRGHPLSVCGGVSTAYSASMADLGALYNNPLLSDFAFEFPDGRSVRAHKSVLALRIPFFMLKFSSSVGSANSSVYDLEQEEGVVPPEWCPPVCGDEEEGERAEASEEKGRCYEDSGRYSYEALVFILFHAYTTSFLRDFASPDARLGLLIETLRFCDMWQLDKLKEYCGRVLERRISRLTVVRIYYHARAHGMNALKDACLSFWSLHSDSLSRSAYLKESGRYFGSLGNEGDPLVDLLSHRGKDEAPAKRIRSIPRQ